jgi:hypothetical protein
MINSNEIAVCISGLATENYEVAIEIAKKVFPYDTFYMHWKNSYTPKVVDCRYFDEPEFNYHPILETYIKPTCPVFKKITRKPEPPHDRGGKLWTNSNKRNHTKHSAKQILGHFYLVSTLPEQYKTIIRLRYDTVVSNKINYDQYLKKAQQGYVLGFNARNTKTYGPPQNLKEHSPGDCDRCIWEIWDHMIFHPRDRFKNVENLYKERNLLGWEWGWYQILCDQWKDDKFINVEGGTSLIKECTAPISEWHNL